MALVAIALGFAVPALTLLLERTTRHAATPAHAPDAMLDAAERTR